MSRIPVRLRLTLAFAAAMAVLLAGAAVLLRVSLARELDASVDQQLRTRAADVAALVVAGGDLADPRLVEPEEILAQVVTPGGRVLDATPAGLRGTPLLGPGERARAAAGPVVVVRERVPGADGRVRLLALPARAGDGAALVVVGASLEDRDDAVRDLTALLAIGGPVALALATLAGYAVAGLALRPVEVMRGRAAAISGGETDARLPVPPARDELRRLAETLNAMLGRVEASVARERAFAADAGHELRTPLAVLTTELDLALRRERTPAELRAALESAAEETERLARLADHLLVLARADGERLPLHPGPVDVAALLERVAARARGRAEAAGRAIVAETPRGLPAPRADALRVEQAVTGLVDNALVHGAGTVRLTASAGDGAVTLHVADEGTGVPPPFAARAFDRFARGEEARGRPGAGLGLAIVRAVALSHGGEAGLLPGPDGTGTDAWVRLPVSGPPEPAP